MKYWLMFWLNSQGLAREAKVECFNHQRVARIEDAHVSKVSVNEKEDHDLVDSLKTAGNAALRLLARNHRDFRACRVVGNYEDPHTPVSGESAGLLFALATYIELLVLTRNHKPFPDPVFAATGSIDEHGVVRKVLDVPAKIRAALDVLPAKSFVFYPKMNFGEVDETLIRLADSRDINLRPVESIGEALKFLEIIVEDWPESRSPYPGLNSFGASQSQIFFGRAAETDALIKTLKQRAENGRPGAMVIASSGTGKSSFVAAGVIATLRFDDRQKELEYAIWQPSNAKGNQVGQVDEIALVQSVYRNWAYPTEKELGQRFRGVSESEEPANLEQLIDLLVKTGLENRRLIWVIDQFEQIFARSISDLVRIDFCKFLLKLQTFGVWVIGTMRSEFYDNYHSLQDVDGKHLLIDAFNPHFPLVSVKPENLQQIISGPASIARVKFDVCEKSGVSLNEKIRAELDGISDPLPLLAFAMSELWERAYKQTEKSKDEKHLLTPIKLAIHDFEEMRGVAGSIGTKANSELEAFRKQHALTEERLIEILANFFDALAVPSADGTKETSVATDLEQWKEHSLERALIDTLVNIRVFTTSGDDGQGRKLLHVSHDALFIHWDKAFRALEKYKRERAIANGFRSRANDWKNSNSRDLLLASPSDIADAKRIQPWLESAPHNRELRDYVNASIQHVDRTKRLRKRNKYAIAALLIMMLVAATYAGFQYYVESIRSSNAEIGATATRTKLRIENGDSISGLLNGLSILAEQTREPLNTSLEASLLRALLTNKEVATLRGNVQEVTDFRVSSDGTQLLILEKSGSVQVRGLDGLDKTGLTLSSDVPVRAGNFAANGTKILTETDGLVRVWARNGALLDSIKTEVEEHVQAISPDGTKLLLASTSGRPRLLHLQDSTSLSWVLVHPGTLRDSDFSSDGQLLVTITTNGSAIVWDVGKSQPSKIGEIATAKNRNVESYGEAVRFSPNGKWIATAFDDGSIFLCETHNFSERCELLSIDKGRISLAFAPDSSELAAVSSSDVAPTSTVYFWKIVKTIGTRSHVVLESRSEQVGYTAYDHSQLVVSSADNNIVHVFDRASGKVTKLVVAGPFEKLQRIGFVPRSSNLVTMSTDGIVRFWDLSSYQTRHTILRDSDYAYDNARFIDDEKVDALDSVDKIHRWQIEAPESGRFSELNSTTKKWVKSQNDAVLATNTNASGRFSPPSACPTGTSTDSHKFNDPNGLYDISIKSPNQLEIRNHSQNDATPRILLHPGPVRCLIVGQSGKLATGSDEGVIRVWNVNELDQTPLVLLGHTGAITDLYFDDRNRRLASASNDKTARLWFLDDAQLNSIILDGHEDALKRVKFSSSGNRLLTTSWDGTVRIWETSTGKALVDAAQSAVTRCTSNQQAKELSLSTAFTENMNRRQSDICRIAGPTNVGRP